MIIRRLYRFTAAALLALTGWSSALAAPSPAAPEMTAADLDAFVSGIVQTQLERNDIAGAVVAVVKDDQVLFAKGYGYADVEHRTPVTADGTLFRIASISKLLTWTAVMQQVEAGKIDLDADVNRYLDFQIPPAFGKPITMRNLMTHTAGFEETNQSLFVRDPANIAPLQQHLASYIPARIFAPGTVGAYSNYGAALAGYIVQRVSGEPFDTYARDHITAPLGMTRTSFTQPLPAALQPFMSKGYARASQPPRPYELIPDAPAGSVAASAHDMAQFMLAELHGGRLASAQILKAETLATMQSRQYALDARDNAMCLGFYEESRNGLRIIGHGGDTIYFHSDLHLIPAAHIGFFVAYNSAGNDALGGRGPLFEKFLDRYFPYTATTSGAIASASRDAEAVAGTYLPSRRGEVNMSYLSGLLGEVTVQAGADGTLSVDEFVGQNKRPFIWRETAPGYWEDTAGLQRRLVFTRDAVGNWQFDKGWPALIYQRAAWYQNKTLIVALLGFGLATCALTLLLWPVAALVRRHHGEAWVSAKERWARIATRLMCGANLLFWGGFLLCMIYAANDNLVIGDAGFNHTLGFVVAAGWIAIVFSLAAILRARAAWRTPGLWWWSRVHRSLVAASGVALGWVGLYAHLIGLHVHY